MNEQEIERCLERFTMGKTTDVMNFDYSGTLAYLQRLKAENDELKARLEKAVELPCKIGDTVYEVHDKCDHRNCPFNGYFGGWRCDYEGKARCDPFIETKQLLYRDIPLLNKTIFASIEAAEARLAELKGGKHE